MASIDAKLNSKANNYRDLLYIIQLAMFLFILSLIDMLNIQLQLKIHKLASIQHALL